MITVLKSLDRGHADHGWLQARHSFSFGSYHNPARMGFRALRVINEDTVAPGAGFPTHAHRDMEIITYVLAGAVAHRDSSGGGGVIRPGEAQYMSAGSGVTHSEFNNSSDEPLHLLQIWLLPDASGHAPRYAQKDFSDARAGRLGLIASPDGRDGSLGIHQDASLRAAVLTEGETVGHGFAPGRHGWLQIARGQVEVSGDDGAAIVLGAGDGASVSGEAALRMRALAPATEFLLFDLA